MLIAVVDYDHPDATVLIRAGQRDERERYGGEDATSVDPAEFAGQRGRFLVAYRDGLAVACAGWRTSGGDAELKRMLVVPTARRAGVARAVLAELERTARDAGCHRMILETGLKQPEAVALYHSAGYRPIPGFGYYADDPESIHLGKLLDVSSPPSWLGRAAQA